MSVTVRPDSFAKIRARDNEELRILYRFLLIDSPSGRDPYRSVRTMTNTDPACVIDHAALAIYDSTYIPVGQLPTVYLIYCTLVYVAISNYPGM